MIYIYRHIRLDKNEPFYIGIGSDNEKQEGQYFRANSKLSRNQYWQNIIKNTKYKIDILLENIPNWEEACEKEKEFIALYGRKDKNLGSLCNMTDGGDGLYNPSKETRLKKSNSMKLSLLNPSENFKLKSINIDWNEVSRKRSLVRDHKLAIKKRSITMSNNPNIWIQIGQKISNNKERGLKISISISKSIFQYSLDNKFIKEWDSLKIASELLNISHSGICNNLKNKSKSSGGFKWKYKNP